MCAAFPMNSSATARDGHGAVRRAARDHPNWRLISPAHVRFSNGGFWSLLWPNYDPDGNYKPPP